MEIKVGTHTVFVYKNNKNCQNKIQILKRLICNFGGIAIKFINSDSASKNLKDFKDVIHKPTNGQWIFVQTSNENIEQYKRISDVQHFDFCDLDKVDTELSLNEQLFQIRDRCKLETSDVIIIGDIHEHLPPLKKIIKDNNNSDIVILGDYLDKGLNTLETVSYIYDLYNKGAKIVVGNHESYVYRRLKGEIRPTDFEKEVFTSVDSLIASAEHSRLFFEIYENSIPYLMIKIKDSTYWATHAPCKVKHLGKLDESSIKKQRNFFFKDRDPEKLVEQLDFLRYPMPKKNLHIFGHVAHDTESILFNNRYWLDTGSVYGNKLSCLHLTESNSRLIQEFSENIKLVEKLIDINKFI